MFVVYCPSTELVGIGILNPLKSGLVFELPSNNPEPHPLLISMRLVPRRPPPPWTPQWLELSARAAHLSRRNPGINFYCLLKLTPVSLRVYVRS